MFSTNIRFKRGQLRLFSSKAHTICAPNGREPSFTYIVGVNDELYDVLGVLIQNLHCGSRYQCCEILHKHKMEEMLLNKQIFAQ